MSRSACNPLMNRAESPGAKPYFCSQVCSQRTGRFSQINIKCANQYKWMKTSSSLLFADLLIFLDLFPDVSAHDGFDERARLQREVLADVPQNFHRFIRRGRHHSLRCLETQICPWTKQKLSNHLLVPCSSRKTHVKLIACTLQGKHFQDSKHDENFIARSSAKSVLAL